MNQYTQLPLPLPDTTIEIHLTKKHIAIIDSMDSDLCAFRWISHKEGYKHYAVRSSERVNGKQHSIRMHRVILERKLGRPLVHGECVDHISGDSLDNRRCNLRVANNSENNRNRPAQANNTSGYKDVFWYSSTGKWQVMIGLNGNSHYLGTYATKEEANAVAVKARKRLHGEFARDE